MHHLSGIFIQRGQGTPSQWNIYLEQGGTSPQWNIYPEGAGCTTLVEYLSTAVGVHHLSGIFIQSRWVHHLSGIFIQRGGVHHLRGIFIHMGGGYTTSVEYLSRGGGTPPQWNINPQGGGGTPPQWNIFPSLPFSPMPHFSTLFFSFGGGCSPVLHELPFFPTFNFHDGFFLWVAVLGKGECQTFSCSFCDRKEGREGAGTTLLSDFW